MPYWLSDPDNSLYLALLLLFVISGGLWLRSRTRRTQIATFIFGLLLLALFLCDRFSETPREEAVRRVKAMSKAYDKKDWNAFLENVSPDFDYRGMTTAALKEKFDLAGRSQVTITFWDFDSEEAREIPESNMVEIAFAAKAETTLGPRPAYIRARFVKDLDNAYRLRSFTIYNYVQRRQEESMPEVP